MLSKSVCTHLLAMFAGGACAIAGQILSEPPHRAAVDAPAAVAAPRTHNPTPADWQITYRDDLGSEPLLEAAVNLSGYEGLILLRTTRGVEQAPAEAAAVRLLTEPPKNSGLPKEIVCYRPVGLNLFKGHAGHAMTWRVQMHVHGVPFMKWVCISRGPHTRTCERTVRALLEQVAGTYEPLMLAK
jgi:hypothetical protein